MVALATGLAVLSTKKNLIGHPVWCAIGVGSGLAFCCYSFTGGCVLALFSMSLWPHLLELLLYHPSTLILTVGMVTYFILTSASALVTGHDIMPGLSLLLNGRPVILMIISIALIVMGIQKRWMFGSNNLLVAPRSRHRKSSSRSSQISFFGSVWRRLSTIDEEGSSDNTSDDDAFEDEVTTAKKKDFKQDLAIMKEEAGKRFLGLVQKGSEIYNWLSFP